MKLILLGYDSSRVYGKLLYLNESEFNVKKQMYPNEIMIRIYLILLIYFVILLLII